MLEKPQYTILLKNKVWKFAWFSLKAKIYFVEKYGEKKFFEMLTSNTIDFNKIMSEIAYYLLCDGNDDFIVYFPTLDDFQKVLTSKLESRMIAIVVAIIQEATKPYVSEEDAEDLSKEKKTLN